MIAPSKEPVVYCGFIIKMTFEDKKMKNYLFFKMKELEFAIQKQSAGSILSNISQDILNNLEIAIPDANTLNDFNAQIEPLLKKQQVNTKQIEALTTQRNTLLPLLMTGQIEV
jgi:type I restriction enzyme S subunit